MLFMFCMRKSPFPPIQQQPCQGKGRRIDRKRRMRTVAIPWPELRSLLLLVAPFSLIEMPWSQVGERVQHARRMRQIKTKQDENMPAIVLVVVSRSVLPLPIHVHRSKLPRPIQIMTVGTVSVQVHLLGFTSFFSDETETGGYQYHT